MSVNNIKGEVLTAYALFVTMCLTDKLKTEESKMEKVHAIVANAINNITKVEFKKDVGIVVIQYKNNFIPCNSVTLFDFGVVSHIKWEGGEFDTENFKISDEEYATFYQDVVNSLL